MKPQYAIEIDEFHGQASAIPNSDLRASKRGAYGKKCSLLIGRDLRASSENCGTGEYIMKPGGYVLASHEWNAYDGNRYTMLYLSTGGTCYLKYYVNDPATVDTAPTAITFYDDANPPAALSPQPTMPVWTVPGFARDAAGQLYVALGPAGVYRIVAQNKTLYAYLTNIPLTHFITFDNLRAWVHPGDVPDQTWSAIGDPTRYFPLPDEMAANPPTYGVDYHYQLAGLGVKGSQVVGETIFGRAKVTWTLDDCFAVFGTGNDGETQAGKIGDGYGLAGFKAFDEFYETLYWFSKKNGGMWVGMTFGRVPKGGRLLETITLGSDYQVSLFDAGWMIADVFQAAPKMTSVLKRVSWGEQQEWAAIPTAQRANLEIGDRPGWVYLKSSAAVAYTPSCSMTPGGSPPSDGFDSYGIVAGNDVDKLKDEQNTYPNGTPATYFKYAIDCKSDVKIHADPILYSQYIDEAGVPHNFAGYPLNNGWGGAEPTEIFRAVAIVTTIVLQWRNQDASKYGTLNIAITKNFGGIKSIKAVRVYGFKKTFSLDSLGATGNVEIGEIIVEGAESATATLYTETPTAASKAVFTGLTPSSAADFGIFWARWYGHGVTYDSGLQIWIRAGTAALSAYDQASPATWSSWTEITGNHLKRGYPLKNLTFSGGGALTASSGGLLYVQAKVVWALSTLGETAFLNYLLFTCYGGSNLTSCFPAGHDADRVFCCLPQNSSSAGPDREVSRNVLGKWSVIDNKKVRSYMQRGDGVPLAFMGYKGAAQYSGQHNYQGTSDDDVELLAEFQSPDLIGDDMLGLNMEVLVGRYLPGLTVSANITSSTGVAATAAITTVEQHRTDGKRDERNCVKGPDGYIYCLYATPFGTSSSLYLAKINPTTRAATNYLLETRSANYPHYGLSLAMSPSGENIYCAWVGYQTADATSSNRRLTFAVFNIASATVTSNADIYSAATGVYYYWPSMAVMNNGVIYMAFSKTDGGNYYMKVIKSINGGTTWTEIISFSQPTAARYVPILIQNHQGNMALFYRAEGSNAAIYHKEIVGDNAGPAISTAATNLGKFAAASNGDDTYLIALPNSGTDLYVYMIENNQLVLKYTKAGVVVTGNPAALALANGMIFAAYNDNTNTVDAIVGQGKVWTTNTTLVTSAASISALYICACRRGNDDVYVVAPYTDGGVQAYRTIKAAVGDVTAAYNLQVTAVSERNSKYAYNSNKAITHTRRIPRSMTMPRMGRRRQIGVHVSGYGILDLERIAFNAGQG